MPLLHLITLCERDNTLSNKINISIDFEFIIPVERIDNNQQIEERVASAPHESQGSLRSALRYLYLKNGPVNLPRSRLLSARQFLDNAEKLVINWLYTRTNGSERKRYGTQRNTDAKDVDFQTYTHLTLIM
jgi:hypothetical protein